MKNVDPKMKKEKQRKMMEQGQFEIANELGLSNNEMEPADLDKKTLKGKDIVNKKRK
ncbi:hypothetical protein NSA47_11790 [Irregularibacter muris]|uniref:Uncharacterized protein n=1 Tax=Irregularibacter muris TaxID=1796619 RepID=A0AAE3L0B9_9FIRM|nr:hypothetical protein [Irregularibacter muris]MCR1899657.1 hypothetical protein [Irregularibacter muris]